jgi:hypothetical protein
MRTGINLSTTHLTIPLLITPSIGQKLSASTLALQWKNLYDRGKVVIIPLGLGSAASFALRLLLKKDDAAPLFITAAILSFSFAPYTTVIMGDVNETLWQRAIVAASITGQSKEDEDEKPVVELVERWARLNLIRGIIFLGAAIVGSWAVSGVGRH